MDKFNINLPVWMNRGEPLTLAHATKAWWERVYSWLTFPLAQIDVDTCDEQLLTLLAYQRDITRFPGESLTLFRLRVKYAFVNAQDAGSIAGFARIFERLEIGQIEQLERQLNTDWDVILIRINDEQLTRNNTLMMNLVRQYGRTCRRYFFDVLNQNSVTIRPGECAHCAGFHSAVYIPTFEITRCGINGLTGDFAPVTAFAGAKYTIETTAAPGEIKWTVSGRAIAEKSADSRTVTITIKGPGPVTVTGRHQGGGIVTHKIAPTRWFTLTPALMNRSQSEQFAAGLGGALAASQDLTAGRGVREPGTLWGEWGDMSVYSWPVRSSAGTSEQYRVAKTTKYLCVYLSDGTAFNLVDNDELRYAVAMEIRG